jgi:hypothetical protein
MNDNQNRIVGIVGRKGSGKSMRLARLLKYCPRFFVIDSMADHTNAVPNQIYDVDEALEFIDWSKGQKTFAAAFVPGSDLEGEFEEICHEAYRRGNMAFVVEEVPFVVKPGYLPTGFAYMVRTGRHKDLDLVWTAQRASEVSRTLTSSTDLWILFSQTEPRDLDCLAERCGREVANKVAGLGLHESFVWDVIARKIIPDSPRLLKRETANT